MPHRQAMNEKPERRKERLTGGRLSMRRHAWVFGLMMAAGFAFSVLGGASAQASEASDFYKGKTLTWIVSTGPGGGHDFYARLIVRHMAKFMPETTLIVK